ncbi:MULTISPECIES: ammonium transporter [Sinorhizobium]|uniref:Ammonium transporter n=1 Tax=Sinorhizobium americanum TaxID=194963 RepID=A0A2S3YIP3_9HYPH|nr:MULTISPECIES: ammonium transporter [Sinorhizobium]ASY58525.1 Ammonium transporter [Sinorhizobium sp. CCBAU 05631]PDT41034.1 ammonium transporter [Sinorhizobium sp. FG01]POH26863.1 ammonia channel protein [Sinorhizobium americanum]
MSSFNLSTSLRRVGATAAALLAPVVAFAQEAAPAAAEAVAATPVPDKGDTTWMLLSTILVLLMTIPGLALFYGGLVRAKNMLSVLMQVLMITAVVMIIWVTYGYSLAFTDGGSLNSFIGGFSKMFLAGVDTTTLAESFSKGVFIPEYVFVVFQMTFACITPALIVGAFAERIKFSAVMLFVILWVTFVYFPVAHMVWFWGGPSAYTAPTGLIFSFGAIDFAGGTVVHINAGIAGLVGAIMLGKRTGYKKEIMAPHSMTLTMVGASLLWVGWFGFNAGSNLEANAYAALAMINTFLATAAAIISWAVVETLVRGKASMLGAASGAVAGLVAVTPAAGFAGPMGAIVLGLAVSPVCYFFVDVVKNKFHYDDSLDVFGIHGVGGILGAIATGILVNPALGGAGIVDYSTADFAAGYAGTATQVWAQLKGVLVTVVWSGIGSAILFKVVDAIVGLRVSVEAEREGLDLSSHGEAAYHAS